MTPAMIQDKKKMCMESEGILCAYVQIPFCQSVCPFCCWADKYQADQVLGLSELRGPYLGRRGYVRDGYLGALVRRPVVDRVSQRIIGLKRHWKGMD